MTHPMAHDMAVEGERLRGQLAAAEAKLRNVRLVCEQLSRAADDVDPRHQPGRALDDDTALQVAEATAIRRAVAAMSGALAGAGHEPRIPSPRHDQAGDATVSLRAVPGSPE